MVKRESCQEQLSSSVHIYQQQNSESAGNYSDALNIQLARRLSRPTFFLHILRILVNPHVIGSKHTHVRTKLYCVGFLCQKDHKLSKAFFSDEEDKLNEVSSGSGDVWLKSISSNSGGKSARRACMTKKMGIVKKWPFVLGSLGTYHINS